METKKREYKSDFARGYFSDGKAEGKAEGVAETILLVLGARGIAVSEEVRTRIEGCDDLEQLTAWSRRAAVAESIEDVFE